METVLGGYRLLRKIAIGSRSDVFLVVPQQLQESPDPPELLDRPDPANFSDAAERSAPSEQLVLKLIRAGVPAESVEREVTALSDAVSPHLVPIRDLLLSDSGQPGLVFPRYRKGNLTALLARREALDAGEAVTILAPIAAAVGVLHSLGIAHGTLGPSRVMFDDVGTPMLTGLGHADCGSDAITADRATLATLLSLVLGRVPGLDAQLWAGAGPAPPPPAVVEQLFRLAAPLPVQLEVTSTRSGASARPLLPARVPVSSLALDTPGQPAESTSRAARHRSLDRRPSLRRPGSGAPSPVSHLAAGGLVLVQQAVERLRSVRRPMWALAAAGGAAAVGALALSLSSAALPAGGTPAPAARSAAAASAATAVSATIGELSAIAADDPLRAGVALLDLRRRCFAQGDARCLASVGQAGSAIAESDAIAIAAGQRLPPTLSGFATLTLVQRTGDSAVLLDESRSLLLIKSEAGWRLREVFLRD